jgi:superfamily I DNA/RNA helicase
MDRSVTWLMEDIGKNKILTDWLLEYVENRTDEGKSWNIESGITEIGRELFGEKLGDSLSNFSLEIIESLNKKIKVEIKQFEKSIKESCKKAIFILQKNNIQKENLKPGIYSFYEKGISNLEEFFKGGNKTIYSWVGGEGTALSREKEKNTELVSSLNAAINDGIIELTVEIQNIVENGIVGYNSATAIHKNIYNLGIIHFLAEKIKQYRNEENTMLISDTRILLKGLIGEEETPFVFEKIGNKFQHILLDEFQDTSNSQWEIIYPLVINILGQGGKVFIVGDAKQAIYKWRGGNVQLIVSQIFNDLGFFNPQKKNLDTNYRSHREIIEFNNLLFSKFQKHEILQNVFQNCSQQVPPHLSNKKGFVEIEFFEKPKKDVLVDEIETKAFEKAAAKTCQLVLDLLAEGYKQKDIAILVSKGQEALTIAQLLNQNQVKVISDNSLVFANYEPIKLLIHTFRLLLDPENKTHYTHVLFLYAKLKNLPFSDEELLKNHLYLRGENTKSLILFQLFPEFGPENKKNWNEKNIYELCEMLIRKFDLQTNTDPFLLQFLDVVLGFFQKKSSSISVFIDWWDFFFEKFSLVVSEDADAVKILTIHKSKGLEFPVVIIPWADWEVTPKINSLHWFKTGNTPYNELDIVPLNFTQKLTTSFFKEPYETELMETFLEKANILYVAFTRAVERLYVFSTDGKVNKIGNILWKALEDIAAEDGRLENDQLVFRFGTKDLPTPKKDKMVNAFTMTLPQSKEIDRKKLNQTFKNREISIGEFTHEVLSKANNKAEMDKILMQMQFLGTISTAQAETIMNSLKSIWELPDYNKWLCNYSIISERDISVNGQLYRPDKIFYNEKETIIVDFKTGKKSSTHKKQVRNYIETIAKMGFPNPIGCLLYLSDIPELEFFT